MAITRRRFVQGSAAATAGLALGFPARKVRGANDQIRVAVVGTRGRGKTHIDWAEAVDGVKVVALCDPDAKILGERAERFGKIYEHEFEQVHDYRDLLDRDDIDVITVATPNHWHSLVGIDAMQAGKDAYVEKPVSHNVWEGRQLVNAARKFNKVCQTGTQSRSNPGMQEMIKFVHDGNLGKVKYVVGTCYKAREPIGLRDQPLNIPEHVDYDLWCGPAAKVPLYRNTLHYNWHWDYNTGNGDIGNQGVHQIDIARWFLGVDHLAPRVMSVGGRFGYKDAGNTPNTQIAYHEYEEAPLIFEVRGLPKNAKLRQDGWNNGDMGDYRGSGGIGVVVQCENGTVIANSYGGGRAVDNDGKTIQSFSGGGDHMQDFIDAVRSRKPQQLNAEIEEGHISSALCHTSNISYVLGQEATPEQIKEQVEKGHHSKAESFARMKEHLRANNIDIDGQAKIALGPWLEMNTKTERFTNNDKANQLLKRDYREPYVVPEINPQG